MSSLRLRKNKMLPLLRRNIRAQFIYEARMEGIEILRVLKEEMSVKALRETIVKEWLDYETDYLGFSTADSFRDEAERYRENGYFGPGISNSLALAASNVFLIPLVVLTDLVNTPVIPIYPHRSTKKLVKNALIWLVFDHTEGNYYMLAQPRESAITSTPFTTIVNTSQDTASTMKGCCCGNGAKRNKIEVKNCNEYRSGCPCFRSLRSCSSSCVCLRCNNLYGKREYLEPTASMSGNKRIRRKREISSLSMSGDKYLDERMRQVTKWRFLEECIVLELVHMVGNGSNIVGTSLIVEFYEQIVAYAKSFGKEIKINVKTE